MDKQELREKRAAIHKEIKVRMIDQLAQRKRRLKRRIKREDLPLEEKREKYRREVSEEKRRLMELAKQEFTARKKMLGPAATEEEYAEPEYEEVIEEEFVDTLVHAPPPWMSEEDIRENPEAILVTDEEVDPGEAFILEDDNTEDRKALRDYHSPIGEEDIAPMGEKRFSVKPVSGADVEVDEFGAQKLTYYIYNLIFHPIQTLDEFDDYLAAPAGLQNVALFYFLSIVPIAVFAYLTQTADVPLPGGMIGTAIGSSLPQGTNVLIVYGSTVLNLLLYSLSIAVVSYLFTDEANLLTLTTYFAFVQGVTSIVIYTFVIAAVLAALVAQEALLIIGLLFLAFIVWRIALSVIVLMSAYGYGLVGALLVVIVADIVRSLANVFFSGLILGKSLGETLYGF